MRTYIIPPAFSSLSEKQFLESMFNMTVNQYKLDRVIIANLQKNKSDEEIQQLTAIRVEAVEGIEHLGYKWWSMNKQPNVPMAFGEVIDIIHFALSKIVRNYVTLETGVSYAKTPAEFEMDWGILRDGLPKDESGTPCTWESIKLDNTMNSNTAVALFERIIELSYEWEGEFDILSVCFALANELGYTLLDIIKNYYGKCALNYVRAELGYGGAYMKVWKDGREDNEHLTDLLKEIGDDYDSITVDTLKHLLIEKYKEVNK